jgi:hypothetical protein
MTRYLVLAVLAVLVVLAGCSPFDRTAIPVGFGSVTEGAASSPSGFAECEVVSVADAGPGTLRECLSRAPVRVTFATSGTITLADMLLVSGSFVTIAGETAPAPGITLDATDFSFVFVGASDVIVRHLAFVNTGDTLNGFGFLGGSSTVRRAIVDRCTLNGATLGFDGTVEDVTVSRSLFRDTAIPLVAISETTPGARSRFTIYANVFTHNERSQPQLTGALGPFDVVDNVVFGWGFETTPARGLEIGERDGVYPLVNLRGNAILHAGSGAPADALVFTCGAGVDDACPGAAAGVFLGANRFPAEEIAPAGSRASEHAIDAALRPESVGPGGLAELASEAGSRFRTAEDDARIAEVVARLGQ